MEPVLSARGIVKVYPNGVEANKGVDIDLYPGRVVALLGENGAGKTTLVKVLTGIERPTRGSITFKGAPARFNSPRDAARLGIYMVPQHPTLFNNLRVYEDVGLALASIGRKTPPATVRSIIRELSSRYGLDVDPDADISGLTVGEKQRVEVLKGILIGTSVLFLDEPSTHMTPGEVKSLISLARRLAGEGRSIVYITHRIDEALEAADELLIMRGGRLVARMDAGSASKGEVLRHMFGSVEEVRRTSRRVGGVVLAIEDLWVKSRHGGWALRGVTLSLRE
ncbi:MAG: ATP-binding cassette domain-containing protein, partial [Desulfurococcales archaeon]|nr:ATP-binding cassette domain-containing protein [Desulfurococcales archaeon]